jgi:HPt (histidine-containing phosphotransfer) domain-containing protein
MSLDLPKEHQLRYLSKRAADIEEIKNGVLCDNFDAAVLIGHRLKGSGETFGFPLITTYGSVIEKAGLCRDKEIIAESLVALTECIRHYLNEMKD